MKILCKCILCGYTQEVTRIEEPWHKIRILTSRISKVTESGLKRTDYNKSNKVVLSGELCERCFESIKPLSTAVNNSQPLQPITNTDPKTNTDTESV